MANDQPSTDTPRTDALQNAMIAEREELERRTADKPSLFFMDEHIERSLQHARQLERENARLVALIKQMEATRL